MTEWILDKLIIQSKKRDYKNADYLHVIGAGLPRTGTSSLKAALELLGFGPCHHMAHLLDDPERSLQFARALDGHPVDFRKLMKGYGSTVDAPTVEFYKDLHQIYPNAKIILTVRDSGEKWFESVKNTINSNGVNIFSLIVVYPIRFLRLQYIVNRKIFQRWMKNYGKLGPQIHDLHNDRVISENRKGEVLVFNVKEGWTPLCKFLGVPIPEGIPFPNINETQQIQRLFHIATFTGLMVWACIFLVISVGIKIFL